MYQDEYGNMWASYADYQEYLNETKLENNNDVMSDLLKSVFSNVYIDASNQVWESEERYIESRKNNE